jgi:anti-sigma B factor antagonist
MKPAPQILVSNADRVVWIRVRGNGSSTNSTALKDFAKEMIQRGAREFIVDLCDCPAMDSTFMGTLARNLVVASGVGRRLVVCY